jgi:hypothetical protein
MRRTRPVHYAALGRYFVMLRGRITQRAVIRIAADRGLALGYQTLRDLEHGKIQHLSPALLDTLATLYDVPYPSLVARFMQHAYRTTPSSQESAPHAVPSSSLQSFADTHKAMRRLDRALARCLHSLAKVRIDVARTIARSAGLTTRSGRPARRVRSRDRTA